MKPAAFIFGHQDHPIALDTPHLPGRQIGYYHYLSSDDLLRLEMLGDPADDRSPLRTHVHLQF
jgi:hypothetical protein